VGDALSGYQRRLFLFLGVATFFEGFDLMALAQALPDLREETHLGEWETGVLVAFVNVGTIAAFGLVRLADRWGRKRVLAITIAGYAASTLASGLAPEAWTFAVAQLAARAFLVGEWAISTVYAAEEFPASKRGHVIGVIGGFATLGAVICAAIVPWLSTLPWGWRTVYLVGAVPVVLLAFARRGIRETERFARLAATERAAPPFAAVLRGPYRRRVFQLALIWASVYLCTQTAVTFFKQHAVEDLHLEESRVGLLIGAAALVTMPAVFAAGKLLDRIGRRKGAALVLASTSAGCVAAYAVSHEVLLFGAIALAMLGSAATVPALNAFAVELFPTEVRGDAYAWSNNLFGRLSFVVAPLAVGTAAEVIGWAPAVAATAIGPAVAIALVLRWMPETAGKELEETSATDGA
jgi:putative MFS transporter